MFGYYMAENGMKAGQGNPNADDDDASQGSSDMEAQLEQVKQLEEQVKSGKMK